MKVYIYNKLYFQYKKLYLIYFKKIVQILNKFHKKNLSQNYWEPIIGLFLRRYLLNYLFLKNFHSKKKFFEPLNFRKTNFFKNYREFADFNDFNSKNIKFFYKFQKDVKYKNYIIKKKSLIQKFFNYTKIIFINLLLKTSLIKILFYESYFKKKQKRLFYLKTFLTFFPLFNIKLEDYKIEKKKIFKNRLNLLNKFKSTIKNDIILQNILFSIPVNYIENFDTIFNEVQRIDCSKAIYVDGNEVNLDFIKFYIGKLRLNRKKILIGQHSLRTGIQDYDSYFDYTKSISNYFLTWGWNEKSEQILKFSSLRIFSSLEKYKKFNTIDNEKVKVCFLFCGFSKVGECLYDNYLENKKAEKSRINLLTEINKLKSCKIFLKPRTGSFILKNQKKFYNQFQIFEPKTRMYKIFGNFKIIIFERISLGIAESIYLNQPTIFYNPKNLYKQKNKKYNQLLNLLKEAKIYFDDKKEILEIIKSDGNINNWWLDKKNIKNRKKAMKKFADVFHLTDLKKIYDII